TLIDSLDDLTETINYALSQVVETREYSRDETRRWIGKGVKRFIIDALGDKYSPQTFAKVREHYLAYYRTVMGKHTRCYDGIPELLKSINAGRKMAVFSNKNTEFIPSLLEHFELDEYFETYLGGDNPAGRKPLPGGVIQMMSQCGASAGETLIVGDMPVDILTAQAAGIDCCAVLWGYGKPDELYSCNPSHVINEPNQLAALL
ncbi:HAD-IA family hydrolase, partial [bacterium]|nr:HAD-IA family hydrolase [bacterium]